MADRASSFVGVAGAAQILNPMFVIELRWLARHLICRPSLTVTANLLTLDMQKEGQPVKAVQVV